MNHKRQNIDFDQYPVWVWASPVVEMVKCLPAMRETWVLSLGPEDPLEKEMATHTPVLEGTW